MLWTEFPQVIQMGNSFVINFLEMKMSNLELKRPEPFYLNVFIPSLHFRVLFNANCRKLVKFRTEHFSEIA